MVEMGLKGQRGFSYLGLMGMIVIMGIVLSVVSQQWSVTIKRDLEKELLFRGMRIKSAIEAYAADYEVKKADRSNRYPRSLEQLAQAPKRYLPKVYKDPITGKDFEVILVKGEIRGVRSTSTGWVMDMVNFKDAATYQEMAFEAKDPKQQANGLDDSNPVNPLNPLLSQTAPSPPPNGGPGVGPSTPMGPGGPPIVMP